MTMMTTTTVGMTTMTVLASDPPPLARRLPIGGLRLCARCGLNFALTDISPTAKLCATCFLKALDLAFYELAQLEGEDDKAVIWKAGDANA